MTSLDISNNQLFTGDAGKALSSALKANSILTELDLSSNSFGPSNTEAFITEFAVGLGANGALATLDMSENFINDNQESNLKSMCSSKSIDLKL